MCLPGSVRLWNIIFYCIILQIKTTTNFYKMHSKFNGTERKNINVGFVIVYTNFNCHSFCN